MKGKGTEQEPYLVESRDDFIYAVSGGGAGQYYMQAADIDIGAIDTSAYDNWQGYYDGNWHIIRGAIISGHGLFNMINGGTVKKIKFDNCSVEAGEYPYNVQLGIVAGWLQDDGLVQDCKFYNCDVDGDNYIGGIIGTIYAGTIERCYFGGNVGTAGVSFAAGGIAGEMDTDFGKETSGSITQCSFVGEITGDVYVGGIIGQIDSSRGSVINCYSRGTITIDSGGAGGILGYGDEAVVSKCYSTCDIETVEGTPLDGIANNITAEYSYTLIATTAGEQRSEADMTYPHNAGNTYITWDFDTIWTIDAENNDGYPYFGWIYEDQEPAPALQKVWARTVFDWGTVSKILYRLPSSWGKNRKVYLKKDGQWEQVHDDQ